MDRSRDDARRWRRSFCYRRRCPNHRRNRRGSSRCTAISSKAYQSYRQKITGIWLHTEYPLSRLPIPPDRCHICNLEYYFPMGTRLMAGGSFFCASTPVRHDIFPHPSYYSGPFPFTALFQHIFYFILAPYGYTISLYIIFIGLERVHGYEIELCSLGKTN